MKCPVCPTDFQQKRPRHRYCSAACRAAAHRSRQKVLQEFATGMLGTREEARLSERRQARHLPPLRRSAALDARAAAEALKELGSPKSRLEILAQGHAVDDLPREAVGRASHYGLAVTLTGSGKPILYVVVGAARKADKAEARTEPARAGGQQQ